MGLDQSKNVSNAEPVQTFESNPLYEGPKGIERSDSSITEKMKEIYPENVDASCYKTDKPDFWKLIKTKISNFYKRIKINLIVSCIKDLFNFCIPGKKTSVSSIDPKNIKHLEPNLIRRDTVFDGGSILDQQGVAENEPLSQEQLKAFNERKEGGQISTPPERFIEPFENEPVNVSEPEKSKASSVEAVSNTEEDRLDEILSKLTHIFAEIFKDPEIENNQVEAAALKESIKELREPVGLSSIAKVSEFAPLVISDLSANQPVEETISRKELQTVQIPVWKPVGIANKSNACYRISTIQALSVFDWFREKIFSEIERWPDESQVEFENRKQVIEALREILLFKGILESSATNANMLMEYDEKFCELLYLRKINSDFQGNRNQQQDAAAFAHALLNDLLGLDLKERITRIGNGQGHLIKRESPVTTISPVLKIEIGKQGGALENLIDKSFATKRENLDKKSPWTPEKGVTVENYKSETQLVGTPPDVLVLQLERYTFDGVTTKINGSEVKIPPNGEIDLKRAYRSESPLKYHLRSFVRHHGNSAKSGHYTSYVFDGGVWFRCDDSVVVKVSAAEAYKAQKGAYIYFFEKNKSD